MIESNAPDLSEERWLLLVRLPATLAVPSVALAAALGVLECTRVESGRYEGRIAVRRECELREVLQACARVGAAAVALAELPPPTAGEPYRRLHDRTNDLARALDAWKRGDGPLPRLRPGELVRLVPDA